MKRDLTVILLCFVAAAGGANVQPILTGAGKLVFPENTVSAYLQASSGALTVAAGGTNKNVILSPTGTGLVATAAQVTAGKGMVGSGYAEPASAGVISGTVAGPEGIIYARDGVSGYMPLSINGSSLKINDFSGGTTAFSGKVGFGAAPTTYPVEVSGDVSVSGVYRQGGTNVGQTTTVLTLVKGTPTATQTNCTMIFSGGIRSGGTC